MEERKKERRTNNKIDKIIYVLRGTSEIMMPMRIEIAITPNFMLEKCESKSKLN